MKLNLECGTDIRNGYVNLNSKDVPHDPSVEFHVCDFRQFDSIAADESVEEMVANGLLHKCNPANVILALSYFKKKLKDGGVLHISFSDFRRLCFHSYNPRARIPLQDLQNLIYGPEYEYKSLIDLPTMKEVAAKLGFTIRSINWDQKYTCSIELVK